MIYKKYKPAFTTPGERDAFFNSGKPVPSGTAMQHVIASGLGLWGDRQELKHDAAKIMLSELDTWADANDEDRLGIPSDMIEMSRFFSQAFTACAEVNSIETDEAFKGATAESDALLPSAAAEARAQVWLLPSVTSTLYYDLAGKANKFNKAKTEFDDEIARIMRHG